VPGKIEERLLKQGRPCSGWLDAAARSMGAFSDITIWFCEFGGDRGTQFIGDCLALLSDEERSRAARFRSHRNRDFFIWRRAIRRAFLSSRIGVSARDIRFGTNQNGKPFIANQNLLTHVHFSMSHTGNFLLLAISNLRELGIDIESVHDAVDVEPLIYAGCNAAERAALMEIPRNHRARAFLQLWTRKEACIKALGAGADALASMPDLTVNADTYDHPRKIHFMDRGILITNLVPPDDFIASLACLI